MKGGWETMGTSPFETIGSNYTSVMHGTKTNFAKATEIRLSSPFTQRDATPPWSQQHVVNHHDCSKGIGASVNMALMIDHRKQTWIWVHVQKYSRLPASLLFVWTALTTLQSTAESSVFWSENKNERGSTMEAWFSKHQAKKAHQHVSHFHMELTQLGSTCLQTQQCASVGAAWSARPQVLLQRKANQADIWKLPKHLVILLSMSEGLTDTGL